jgi:uncharacterized transporter YbjL
MKKIITLIIFVFTSTVLFAQEAKVEMADEFRKSGKIYVVVAVASILFVAFVVYLFSIDKRLKKIENKN